MKNAVIAGQTALILSWLSMVAVGCTDDGTHGGADAGEDTFVNVVDDITVEYVTRTGDEYSALEDDERIFEIITGFQGGYHLEPAFRIEGPADRFIVAIEQVATDIDTNETVSSSSAVAYLTEDQFSLLPDRSFVNTSSRVVLDTYRPCEMVGKRIRLDIEVRLDGTDLVASDSVVVRLKDDEDEYSGDYESCPTTLQTPPDVGTSCSAADECDDYLICIDEGDGGRCEIPAGMSGERIQPTKTAVFERDGAEIASLNVEVADDDFSRSRGLAHRPCMHGEWGMVFEYPEPALIERSLDSMCFASDFVFADADGEVVAVHTKVAPKRAEPVSSDVPAKFAIQLVAGNVEAMGVRVGDQVIFQ